MVLGRGGRDIGTRESYSPSDTFPCSHRGKYTGREQGVQRIFFFIPGAVDTKPIAWPKDASLETLPWLGLCAVPGLGPKQFRACLLAVD